MRFEINTRKFLGWSVGKVLNTGWQVIKLMKLKEDSLSKTGEQIFSHNSKKVEA